MHWLQRIDNLPLRIKGLLILIPIGFQVFFLIALWVFHWNLSSTQSLVLHSKEILTEAESTYGQITRWHSLLLAYVMTGNQASYTRVVEFGQHSEEGFARLTRLLDDEELQWASIKQTQERFGKLKQLVGQVIALVQSGQSDKAVSIVQRLEVGDQIAQVREQLDTFIAEVIAVDARRIASLQSLRTGMVYFLSGGSAVAIIALLLATWAFTVSISKRLNLIASNVDRIKQGIDLPAPDRGDDEIAELDHTLHALSHALREKNLEVELFVYSVSHDLRSPLVNLQGFREELSRATKEVQSLVEDSGIDPARLTRLREILTADIGSALRFINAAVDRVSSIIDALLKLSRAGRVQYAFEKVDLKVIVNRVVESTQGSIRKKGANVEVGELPSVFGDPTAIGQIFGNVLTNALQYLDPERPGKVSIFDCSVTEASTGEAVIAIKDNGLGIPTESQKKLFLAFQRFHPGSGSGEGVGLALSRRMISRMGGRIWVTSTEGKGSCFFLSFPTSVPATGSSLSHGGLAEEKSA